MQTSRLKQVLPVPAALCIALPLLRFSLQVPAQLQTGDCNKSVPEKRNYPLPFPWAGTSLPRRTYGEGVPNIRQWLSLPGDYCDTCGVPFQAAIRIDAYPPHGFDDRFFDFNLYSYSKENGPVAKTKNTKLQKTD